MSKVAFVTGAGQGIGRAIALELLNQDFQVVIAERDAEAGREAEQELGPRTLFVEADVSDEASVANAVTETLAAFGTIDALVNNAGISESFESFDEVTLDDWNRIVATNLTGAFLCARHCAPELRRKRGHIVNIASVRAWMSEPGWEAYSASKGGLVSLTAALAVSLAPDVAVNCVSPGWIEVRDWKKKSNRREPDLSPEDHAEQPIGRVGRPGDIASLVAWLVTQDDPFVTGAHLVADGGISRKITV